MYKEGFTYHIKDDYFEKAKKNGLNNGLMQNKESGGFRPTFYCLKDKKTGLLWMVPLSSKVEKYKNLKENQERKYGRCLTIVIGKYNERENAFLIQNMFPVTEDYIDHIHTVKGIPLPVKFEIRNEIETKVRQVKEIIKRGKTIVFPDVKRLEHLMLEDGFDK
jgi:hypothetical protein